MSPTSELSVCRHKHRDEILTLGTIFSPRVRAQSSPHAPVSSVFCSAIWTESMNSCPTFNLSSMRQSRKDLPQTRNCLHQSLPAIFFNSPCRRISNHSVTPPVHRMTSKAYHFAQQEGNDVVQSAYAALIQVSIVRLVREKSYRAQDTRPMDK